MNSNIIISEHYRRKKMLDETTLNNIITKMNEAFETICEEEEVQVFEDDFEIIEDAIRSIRGFER